MHGEGGHQGEAGALHELLVANAPLQRPVVGEAGFDEEVDTALIAEIPGIEIANPGVELGAGGLRRIIDDGGEDTGLVHAALPEIERKGMIAPVGLAGLANRTPFKGFSACTAASASAVNDVEVPLPVGISTTSRPSAVNILR